MPKKILFESARHQLLCAAKRLADKIRGENLIEANHFLNWIQNCKIENSDSGKLGVFWNEPIKGEHILSYQCAKFYTRGDAEKYVRRQEGAGLVFNEDTVMMKNKEFFDKEVQQILFNSGLFIEKKDDSPTYSKKSIINDRIENEEAFHNNWAYSSNSDNIDVIRINEACTSPEIRHIVNLLGDITGKSILDVGCGLGEVSVYFAIKGAIVTATDLSKGMCEATQKLAYKYGVKVKTCISASENFTLNSENKFDIIYTGNTLHHVDINKTLPSVLKYLKDDGVFVSWDPIAYNPIINLYRLMATKVRTKSERPLSVSAIKLISSHFQVVKTKYFWLSTLIIFMLMFLWQGRNPNKERFWKKVVDEEKQWEKLFRPLEKIDNFIISYFPYLHLFCWNVVIYGRGKKNAT